MCCQHLKLVLLLLECLLHLFSSRHHDAQARAPQPLRVFVTLCVRAIVRLRSRERTYLSVEAGMRYACDSKAERTSLPNDSEATALSHATNMHGLVNTKRVWMGQRECAAQQQRNKKSILMIVPTRQCLRRRKRDKTGPSLQEHKMLARKQKNGSIAERHKTEVEFHHTFLDCSLVPLHEDASYTQLTDSVADVSLQLITTDVDSSISLASSQISCNVKTRFPFPSAPHPAADIVSFCNLASSSQENCCA